MADSKLAGPEGKALEISPMAKTSDLDAARTRSHGKDRIAKENPLNQKVKVRQVLPQQEPQGSLTSKRKHTAREISTQQTLTRSSPNQCTNWLQPARGQCKGKKQTKRQHKDTTGKQRQKKQPSKRKSKPTARLG